MADDAQNEAALYDELTRELFHRIMDDDAQNDAERDRSTHNIAEKLRRIWREHNLRSPDDQWNVDEVTDEFAEEVYRNFCEGFAEDLQWQRFRKRLRHPAFIAPVFAFLSIAIGFIFVLATLLPAWVTWIWLLPIGIAFVLAIPFLRQIASTLRATRKLADVDQKSAESWAEGLVEFAIQQRRAIQTRDDAVFDSLSNMLGLFVVVYWLPMATLEFVGRRYQTYFAILRFVPVTLNVVWDVVFLTISFVVARHGFPFGGLFLASTVGISSFLTLLGNLRKIGIGKFQGMTWLDAQRDSIRIQPFLRLCILVVISFASCYHAIGISDQHAFSRPLDALDAVYFSVVTAATVGFGDITPVSALAKVVCMIEIGCSFVATVFVIATVVNVWQGVHLAEHKVAQDSAPPSGKVQDDIVDGGAACSQSKNPSP